MPKRLESPGRADLLTDLVKTFAEAIMSAEADAVCGAGYEERSPERINSRDGYRLRDWDTRARTIELAIPKLRSGSLDQEQAIAELHGSTPTRPTVLRASGGCCLKAGTPAVGT